MSPVGVGVTAISAAGILSRALELAGNTSIPATTAVEWLNDFLEAEYHRKYWFQRQTQTISAVRGTVGYTAAWDADYLDLYEQEDGTCGRFTDAVQNITPIRAWSYRDYIARPERLTAEGAPQRVVPDKVGGTWYVFPKPDAAYTITVDIYVLPPRGDIASTPLWVTYAPVEILVQAVKVAALFHQDDLRWETERDRLYGNPGKSIPGMLPQFRRATMAREGVKHQGALDRRVFLVPTSD